MTQHETPDWIKKLIEAALDPNIGKNLTSNIQTPFGIITVIKHPLLEDHTDDSA